MTNENELKVGDIVSYQIMVGCWICGKVKSADIGYSAEMYFNAGKYFFLRHDEENIKWQHGIHPSLIPEGFTLIKEEDRQALIMSLANKVDVIEANSKELEAAKQDVTRMDFLASTEQFICNVQMPREIVEANLTSLRDAIDVCIAQTKKPEESK